MRTIGKETDLVKRKDVLRDIDELIMFDKPSGEDDVRIQVLSTVLSTSKVDAIPIEWIRKHIESECAEHGIFRYTLERMLEYWEQEQARKPN